jgi:hypothetical protein
MLSLKGARRWVNEMSDKFPVLQGRRNRSIDAQKVDEVRRVLCRAFQDGSLSEEEFASTLERLGFATSALGAARRLGTEARSVRSEHRRAMEAAARSRSAVRV